MKNWTEQELRLALALYCQLPFGKMHSRNPAIIGLAENIGRTPAALAMKLVNFASLDPEITANGRVGLGNASALDKQVWKEFHENWDRELLATTESLKALPMETDTDPVQIEELGAEETSRLAFVEIRTKQPIFRRMVLSSYASRCCMSGLSDPRLLVASHIIPWNKNEKLRLNPHNGLCLSVLHDKAFDRGLLAIRPDYTIAVSPQIGMLHNDPFAEETLGNCEGQKIRMPEKFAPGKDFLRWHLENVFVR